MSWTSTELTRRLGIPYPLIQAPMAGGPTTPKLVAAVCEAGGLGSFAAAHLPPGEIGRAIAEIRALTARPFNVNLFAIEPPPLPAPAEIARMAERLRPYRAELGLPDPPPPVKLCESFAAQAEAVIAARPAVLSFTFGMADRGIVAAARQAGIAVIGTATNLLEGEALEALGVDFVCAQGVEAGGHRGTFIGTFEESEIGTMALVSQLAARLRTPVIAAGGIMNGRGIAAALALGACAAQLGTAFLPCPEAGTSVLHRQALLSPMAQRTALTRAFSGRPARGIRNRFLDEMAPHAAEVPPYPVQLALMADIRAAAAKAGRGEFLSLWAGQAAALARPLPAPDLIATLIRETGAVIGRLTG